MPALPDNWEDFFNQALEAERGIAVELESEGQAVRFKQKLNQGRVKQRKINASVYPQGHLLHNKTPWDDLVVTSDPTDASVVLIKRISLEVKKVRVL